MIRAIEDLAAAPLTGAAAKEALSATAYRMRGKSVVTPSAWPARHGVFRRTFFWRFGLHGALFVLVFLAGVLAVIGQPEWMLRFTDSLLVLVAASLLCAVLLAIPFMPSIELGLLIMLAFGRPGIAAAWLATVLGLNLAYAVGRMLSPDAHHWLLARAPGWVRRGINAALRGRLRSAAILGLLLNMPGNTLVGGGGGISLAYGAGRLLRWPAFLSVSALATAVVPIMILTGLIGIERVITSTG